MNSNIGSQPPQPVSNMLVCSNATTSAEKVLVHYQKNNLIGKGTFGKVYTALDLTTGGLLAVKCIKLSSKTDRVKRQKELAQIENEVNLLKNLKHPNIVKYHCL